MLKDNIKRLRLEHRLSQEQFARRLHVTQGAVSQWESGRTLPDTAILLMIASEFNVPLDFLNAELPERDFESLAEMRRKPQEPSFPFVTIRRKAVPIVGEIACGTPIAAEQNIEGYADVADGIRADYALKCKGDSMKPTFLDGDIVLIRQQEDVDDGQIAVVLIDGEATLKRVYHEKTGILLVADNPSFPPIRIEYPDDSPRIQGFAVGFTRMIIED